MLLSCTGPGSGGTRGDCARWARSCVLVVEADEVTRMLRSDAIPRNWLTSFAGKCNPASAPARRLLATPPANDMCALSADRAHPENIQSRAEQSTTEHRKSSRPASLTNIAQRNPPRAHCTRPTQESSKHPSPSTLTLAYKAGHVGICDHGLGRRSLGRSLVADPKPPAGPVRRPVTTQHTSSRLAYASRHSVCPALSRYP
jgi:hypothetical protein